MTFIDVLKGYDNLKNFTVGNNINAKKYARKDYIQVPDIFINDVSMTNDVIIRLANNKSDNQERLNEVFKVFEDIKVNVGVYGSLTYMIDNEVFTIKEFDYYNFTFNSFDDDGNAYYVFNIQMKIKKEKL